MTSTIILVLWLITILKRGHQYVKCIIRLACVWLRYGIFDAGQNFSENSFSFKIIRYYIQVRQSAKWTNHNLMLVITQPNQM